MNFKLLNEKFKGKICTILTQSINKSNFKDDRQFSDFFTVIIDSIDEHGIQAKHCITGCIGYYFLSHVVAILEEQVVSQDDPQYEDIIKEIKKDPENKIVLPPNKVEFVNPDIMDQLSQKAQEVTKMLRKN